MVRTARFLVAGVPLVAAAGVLLPGHGRGVPMALYGLLTAWAIREGVRRHRPRARTPWLLLVLTTFTGCGAVALHAASGRDGLDMHPAVQVLVAGSLACWVVGSALFVRARARTLDAYQLLDLAIFLISATVAFKRLLLDPTLEANPPPGMSPQTSMTFITLQFVSYVLYARFLSLPGRRPAAAWLLALSLSASIIGSVLTSVVSPVVGLHLSTYLAATAAMLAALHPSMAELTEPSPATTMRFGAVRAVAIGVALLLSPVAAAVVHARGGELALGWFLAPTIAVTLLVLARLRLAFAQEQAMQEELETSRAQFQALIHNISDVVLVVDGDRRITYASASSEVRLGLASAALVGRPLPHVVLAGDREQLDDALRSLPRSRSWTGLLRAEVNGGIRTFEADLADRRDDPNIGGLVVVLHDVTEREQLAARLRHQASHDALTGLPNRLYFTDHLAARLAAGVEPGVLFVDLDDFKAVNDGLGHRIGDELLRAVASRLGGAVRADDVVARLGGDEFAVLVEDGEPEEVAGRIIQAMAEPFLIGGHRLVVQASIGVADRRGTSAENLLANADLAMYRAKALGKGGQVTFEDDMHAEAADRLHLQLELADAIGRDELRLVYQPIFDLVSGRMVGAEALVRWDHPTRGLLAPDRFVPVAEATGQIVPIGSWVLEQACREACAWPDDVRVGVNLSSRQLESDPAVEEILAAIARSGLPPERLVLEITESTLPRDLDATAARLERLRYAGVRIAVDDFGTGYSALSTLSRLPVDVLKIDRSFVASMLDDGEASALVHVLLELGRALRLEIVAEGIEDGAQAAALRARGCAFGQGFHLGRPVGPLGIRRLLPAAATPA